MFLSVDIVFLWAIREERKGYMTLLLISQSFLKVLLHTAMIRKDMVVVLACFISLEKLTGFSTQQSGCKSFLMPHVYEHEVLLSCGKLF